MANRKHSGRPPQAQHAAKSKSSQHDKRQGLSTPNPTPGLGDGEWLYGHNWVCLAMLIDPPLFGIIALSLLSQLYVRKVDIEKRKQRYNRAFRTKHELALGLCRQVMRTLRAMGSTAGFIVVFDGAYAAQERNLNVTPLRSLAATSRSAFYQHFVHLHDLKETSSIRFYAGMRTS